MRREGTDVDVHPREEGEQGQHVMQGRGVLGLPEPHVGPSAGNAPDAQKVALLRQLAGLHGFLADEAVAFVPRPVGRPGHLNLNEKFHRTFHTMNPIPATAGAPRPQQARRHRPRPRPRRSLLRSAQPPSAQEMTFSGSIVTIVRSAGQSET